MPTSLHDRQFVHSHLYLSRLRTLFVASASPPTYSSINVKTLAQSLYLENLPRYCVPLTHPTISQTFVLSFIFTHQYHLIPSLFRQWSLLFFHIPPPALRPLPPSTLPTASLPPQFMVAQWRGPAHVLHPCLRGIGGRDDGCFGVVLE